MIPAHHSSLLQSIAKTVADYRRDEISAITPDHVERWVRQFDHDARTTIVQEMDRILSRYYISRRRATKILKKLLSTEGIFGASLASTIANTEFLNIQELGSSQRDVRALMAGVLQKGYGIRLSKPFNPSRYVYLDDCLFTGNRIYRDIERWIPTANPSATLYIITLGAYTKGIRNVNRRMADLEAAYGLDIRLWCGSTHTFENIDWSTGKYDCLWPEDELKDARVDAFVQQVETAAQMKGWPVRLFRPANIGSRETLFSSTAARRVVEQAFLKAGAYIWSLPKIGKPNIRPMGYEYFESLGFGAMFVTYRNIANNCPLALWWGDSTARSDHPFSKWYPLFPRRTNGQPSSMMGDTKELPDSDTYFDNVPF